MKTAQLIVKSCYRRALELEQVKNFVSGNGYSMISEDFEVSKEADLIILSTCAFTAAEEDSAIETLHRIQREKKPSAKVIVCGCLPEINPDRLSHVFDGESFGPRSYERLNEILRPEKRLEEFARPNTLLCYQGRADFSRLWNRPLSSLWNTPVKTMLGKPISGLRNLGKIAGNARNYYAYKSVREITGWNPNKQFYIQIHEGCSCNCSYCAIRLALGQLKSKPVDEVIREMQNGLNAGYESIYFIADSVGTYGFDIGTNIANLLERVLQLDGSFTLYLNELSAAFLHLGFKQIKALCEMGRIRALWVTVQSANPRILALMRIKYNVSDVQRMMIDLKSNSRVKLGTTIIVGFPSETRAELNESIEFCRRVGFDWVYCHGFSARPRTDAAKLPGQLSVEEVRWRRKLVRSRLPRKTLVLLQ